MEEQKQVRHSSWVSPTGVELAAGGEFRVRGKRDRYRFIAFVENSIEPYVECVRTNYPGVRCVRPELVERAPKKRR